MKHFKIIVGVLGIMTALRVMAAMLPNSHFTSGSISLIADSGWYGHWYGQAVYEEQILDLETGQFQTRQYNERVSSDWVSSWEINLNVTSVPPAPGSYANGDSWAVRTGFVYSESEYGDDVLTVISYPKWW